MLHLFQLLAFLSVPLARGEGNELQHLARDVGPPDTHFLTSFFSAATI